MSYIINLKIGETVSVDNGRIKITPEQKSGQRVKLRFDAPDSVHIEKLDEPYKRELKPLALARGS